MKFPRNSKRAAVVAAAILGLALIVGCGAGSTATKAGSTTKGAAGGTSKTKTGTQDLKPGDTINQNDGDGDKWTVTVNKVTYRTTGCAAKSEFNVSNPEKGDAYVMIDVTYESTSGDVSYNPLDWSVVDKNGNESTDLAVFAACKPELGSSNSLHGKRHGLVAIEVKKGVTHGQAVYSTDLGTSSSSWDF